MMRRFVPVVVAGPLAGLALYASLIALTPASAHGANDPWAAHFRAYGYDARLRSVSRQPHDHFAIIEWRPMFTDPSLTTAVLKTVEVDRVDVQIAEFPSEPEAQRVFGKEHGRQKLRRNTDPSLIYHWQRVGRYAAVVPPVRGRPGLLLNAPPEAVTKILRGFVERAETLP